MKNKYRLNKKCFLALGLIATHICADEVSNFLDGVQFKGFGFARYTGVDGKAGYGDNYQIRLKIDATSKAINGYSFTAGIYVNQGSSNPTLSSNTHGAVQGSQGIADSDSNFSDRFSLATLYGSKQYQGDSIKSHIHAGRLNMYSVFTDKNTDVGLGATFGLSNKSIAFNLSYFDSYMTNNLNYSFRAQGYSTNRTMGLGNNLTILEFKSAKKLGDIMGFNASIANATGLVDYMAFLEVNLNMSGFYILAQTASMSLNATPFWSLAKSITGGNHSTWTPTSNATRPVYGGFGNDLLARNRGIYNVQLGFKNGDFGAKLGYLGSFGDGYGVLLDSRGAINVGGKVWANNIDASSEGFGILGSGGRDGTSIMAAYGALEYRIFKPLKLGLDVSYIGGNNNYAYVNVAKAPNLAVDSKGINFFEIAPSFSYNLSEKLTFSAFYARWVGDVEFGKTRAEIRYQF